MTTWRGFRASPLALSGAVAILAAGIGITLAVLGLVSRALFLAPPGLESPERLVSLTFAPAGDRDGPALMTSTSWVSYRDLAEVARGFQGTAAWRRVETGVFVGGEQAPAGVLQVSGRYFDVLGTKARYGRTLTVADEREAAPVAVLSDSLWRTRFARETAAIGRTIAVNGIDLTIVGVMPPGFTGHAASAVDLWMPYATARRDEPGWQADPYRRVVSVVARLAPGATTAAAEREATAALGRRVGVSPLNGGTSGSTERRIALWLAGIALLVLVLAAADAATLLIIRAVRRRREFAIRAALGATLARLRREAALEAAVVALAAGFASIAFGRWFEEAIRRVLLPDIPAPAALNAWDMLAAGTAIGLAFAVALGASLVNLPSTSATADLSALARAGRPRRLLSRALLVVEATLSVVLLAGAGMFGRSLVMLLSQDFGMTMNGVLLVEFADGSAFVPDQADIFRAGLDRVRRLPSVAKATVVGMVPFTGFMVPPISVPGRPVPSVGEQLPFLHAATPEFLDILGIRIVEGRGFSAADETGPPVVIVNESMARGVWPGESAIGKCIRIGFDPDFDPAAADGPPTPSAAVPCRAVVGVAHDLRQRSVVPAGSEASLMQYFVPFSQVPPPPAGIPAGPGIHGLLVRVAHADAATIAAVRDAVVNGRADLPYVRVRPYTDLVADQLRPLRTATLLLVLLAALAVVVGASGLYAVFAQAVALRMRELAIRQAVGATPAAIVRGIVGEAVALTALGTVLGWAAAFVAVQSVRSLLFGTSPLDPLVAASLATLMLAVATAASFAPARTALRANPTELLRSE